MYRLVSNLLWIYKKCKSYIPSIILIIVISSAISFSDVGKALISKYIIDSAVNSYSDKMVKWLIILSILLLLQILLSSFQSIFNTYCSEKLRNTLQKHLYKHIIYSKWRDQSQYHSVEFLTRLTNDVNTIVNMICSIIPNIFSLGCMLVSSVIALLYLSKMMALIAIILFPFLIFLSKIYGRKLRKFYISIQQKETLYNRFIQESFNNILILKSFCLERKKLKFLKCIQKDKLNLSIKKSYFSCISNAFLALSSLIGYFLVFAWGSFALPSAGVSIFGNLTAMIQLFDNIELPIYELSSSLPQLISAIAATDRLIDIEKMNLEKYKNNNLENIYLDSSFSNNLKIKFDNISFSYIPGLKILDNISFTVSNGDIAAIMGPSGNGKTTIVRLLLSLIEPDSGTITINDNALTYNDRRLISYVPQGNTLFSGTILDNLTLGFDNIDEASITQALKMSCSFDFVNSLKDKINTVIGENGLGISQGQAQRLSIARAFLRKSPILILDEATSSLDSDTELCILKEIKNLYYKPLCIIITHRESALSICNKVYRLKNNSIFLEEIAGLKNKNNL